MDYFAVFGLPRRLVVDVDALQQRFYELSREHHPDFHQAAPTDRQAEELAASALVNRAYRTLREPLARLDYLIGLVEGREPGAGPATKPRAPMDLLEEMMEVQETLEEARATGLDAAARERLDAERHRLQERWEGEERATLARFAEWDAAGEAERRALGEWFKQRLATRAYLRTVIDDLSQALGEAEESHVAHRRH